MLGKSKELGAHPIRVSRYPKTNSKVNVKLNMLHRLK